MSSIIIIPARGGSKGVIKKNKRSVKGVPLFLRTLNHAQVLARSSLNVCISSDDGETWELFLHHMNLEGEKWVDIEFNELIQFGNIWFHKRSPELSRDNSLILSSLQEIRLILISKNLIFATWCLLQPTTPFRSRTELESIRKILEECGSFESLVSVTKVEDSHPARMYTIKGNFLVPVPGYEQFYYSRRQDLPALYIRDGGFYVIGDALVKDGFQYSHSPKHILRDWPWSINIDTSRDFSEASTVDLEFVADDPNEKGAKYES